MAIVICCPSYEGLTQQDKQEIYNLLKFKERLKRAIKNGDYNDNRGTTKDNHTKVQPIPNGDGSLAE